MSVCEFARARAHTHSLTYTLLHFLCLYCMCVLVIQIFWCKLQAVHPMEDLLVPDADSETKLYLSNLDYGVTNEDIKVTLISSFYICRACFCLYSYAVI